MFSFDEISKKISLYVVRKVYIINATKGRKDVEIFVIKCSNKSVDYFGN